jgi:hypothetical protein
MQDPAYPPAAISTSGAPTLVSGSTWSATTIATWSVTISGQPYGNGVYRISAPAGYPLETQIAQYLVFDSDTQYAGAHWRNLNYANGEWNGGTSNSLFTLDSSYYGDWVYIQLPEAIVLSSCNFKSRTEFPERAPSKLRIYGSNDGTSWTVVHDQTTALAYSDGIASIRVRSTSSYTYFAVVVSALPAGGGVLNFIKWSIFGKVRIALCFSLWYVV